MGEEFDRQEFAELLKNQRLDDAIAYVDRFLEQDPDNPTLKLRAARARGGKGEDILTTCDRTGVMPSPEQIDTMCGLFQEAIALDAFLAAPYWDLAVIHARFLQQPDQAADYLGQAKRLGFKHRRMKQLEALIEAARS